MYENENVFYSILSLIKKLELFFWIYIYFGFRLF